MVAANHKESFAIKFSIGGAVVMAIMGLLAAIFGNSMSLLFDSLNTILGIAISTAGLRISHLLKIKYSKRFNFGYYSFEPLFVLANGLLMLVLAVSLFITSVQTILDGGRKVELPIVTSYLVFSITVCCVEAIVLRRLSKKVKSELVHTESINWLFDTLTSLVVLGAFLLSIPLKHTSYRYLVPYLDPGITIVLIICIIYQPIKLIKSGSFDLLRMAPSSKRMGEIKEKLMDQREKYGYSDIKILAAKAGRTTCVEVICLYHKNFEITTIDKLDTLRKKIKEEVENEFENLEVTVTFNTLKK